MNIDKLKELVEHSKQHDVNKEYYDFLKDKTVEIVGPSEHLFGLKNGKKIDDSDLIIRFNSAIHHVPYEKLKEDIGSRCDIIYMVPGLLKTLLMDPKKLENTLKLGQVKWIAVRPNSHNTCSANNRQYPNKADDIQKYFINIPIEDKQTYNKFRNFAKERKIDVKLFIGNESDGTFNYALSTLKKDMVGEEYPIASRTGFLPVWDMMCSETKSVNICGMTFYHKGGHMFRDVTVNNKKELHPLLSHANKDVVGAHDSIVELRLMRMLYIMFKDNKLTVDSVLEGLLKEEDPHKTLYSDEDKKIAQKRSKNNGNY